MRYHSITSWDSFIHKVTYALEAKSTSSLPTREKSIIGGEAWWEYFGEPFNFMLQQAGYAPQQRENYLFFLRSQVIPELGLPPYHLGESRSPETDIHWSESSGQPTPPYSSPALTSIKLPGGIGADFKSFMTDDHTPIEFSWQFATDGNSKPKIRFSIDPVVRQTHSDSRGAIGIFEDISRSKMIAEGNNLEWTRICVNTLTMPTTMVTSDTSRLAYPSQYFVGFEYTRKGVVLKAYFMPEVLSAQTSIPKRSLITDTITMLSRKEKTDLITPWNRVLSFFDSLPVHFGPDPFMVAVDCVEARHNRVKVYARTPVTSLSTIRRFFTLDRSSDRISGSIKQALKQISLLWKLLFPEHSDESEVPSHNPSHLTTGLLFYYELRAVHSEPFPKVYIPVRHLCRNDEQVVCALMKFYDEMGQPHLAQQYAACVRNIFSHRPLGNRSGIHTYITLAAKQDNVEVTAYFNPECYAPERIETLF